MQPRLENHSGSNISVQNKIAYWRNNQNRAFKMIFYNKQLTWSRANLINFITVDLHIIVYTLKLIVQG